MLCSNSGTFGMQSYGLHCFDQMCQKARESFVFLKGGLPSRLAPLWHSLGHLWSTCSSQTTATCEAQRYTSMVTIFEFNSFYGLKVFVCDFEARYCRFVSGRPPETTASPSGSAGVIVVSLCTAVSLTVSFRWWVALLDNRIVRGFGRRATFAAAAASVCTARDAEEPGLSSLPRNASTHTVLPSIDRGNGVTVVRHPLSRLDDRSAGDMCDDRWCSGVPFRELAPAAWWQMPLKCPGSARTWLHGAAASSTK